MQSFTCTALLGIPLEGQTTSLTRLSRSVADLSKSLSSLSILSHLRSLNPESTSTLGLGCSAFARHYLRNHFRFLFLGLLRCFTSPRFASLDYEFIQRYPDVTRDGLSHSEIPGSKPACGSPGLIATYYVLHRLLAPRHSPHALSSLITKLNPSDILRFQRASSRQTQRIIVICPKIYLCVVVKEHRLSFPSKVFSPENFHASQNLHHRVSL